MDSLVQDLKYALRTLGQHRTYATVVVLTMALGIGANASIFSVVDGVLLRPLPYARGDELMVIEQDRPLAGVEDQPFSVHEIRDYRAQATTLAGLVEYHDMWFILLGRDEPERVQTGVVSAGFFDVMGVAPLLGRTFREDDDQPGAPAVLVLSYSYWQRSFGGDPTVVGRAFRMNDRPHTVVGVLPPVPQYPVENDVYMPTSACPFRSRQAMIDNRDARMMRVFARVKPGVTPRDCHKDLALVAARLQQTYPSSYPEREGYRVRATPLREELTDGMRPTLIVLLGTAGFVLLIVCASLANLTVARVVRRERELAVRAALGAGRSRLLRQLLTESVLLSVVGGALGVLLAWWSLDLLVTFTQRFTTRAAEISIDYRVLLFALAVSMVTGLVFGTLPAWSTREDLVPALRDGARTSGGRAEVRRALIVAQVAVSLILLVGAGLLLRSLLKLHQIDPGFTTERVLTMRIDLNFSKYRLPEPRAAYFTALLERLGNLPGVTQVAAAATFPLNERGPHTTSFAIEGQPVEPGSAPQADFRAVSPDYFKTIGVPLLRGRDFNSSDTRVAPPVVIVSQSLMRHVWKNDDPVGKRISVDGGRNWATIVGVVGDARQQLDRAAHDEFYSPVLQTPLLSTTVLLKAAGDPIGLARQVRSVAYAIDPDQPVDRFRTLDDVRADVLARPRQTATLLAIFAALALVITATGLAGVIAFSVNQRTQEFGVRMALGAPRASVLRMVVGEGLRLVLAGLALGVCGAMLLTRVLADLLYGIEPTDALTFLAVSLVLIAVALVACFVPARRAASVDPLAALRTV